MYKKVEEISRMTRNEASERYPDSFIVMQMDSMNLSDDVGTVFMSTTTRGNCTL